MFFSDIKECIPVKSFDIKEDPKKYSDNCEYNKEPILKNFRDIEYIQARARNFYNTNSIHINSFGEEITNFFFLNNHHIGYENEIERVKNLINFLIFYL